MKWYKITKTSVVLAVCLLLSGCSTHKKANKVTDYENRVATDSTTNRQIVHSAILLDSLEVTELKWDFYPATDTMQGSLKSIVSRRIIKKATSKKSNASQENSNVKINDSTALKSNEKVELKSTTPSITLIAILAIAILIILTIKKRL